jgi:signal peptidase I
MNLDPDPSLSPVTVAEPSDGQPLPAVSEETLAAPPKRRWGRLLLREVLLPLVIAFAVAMTVQATVAKPFEISTGSMNPTIMPSDRVLANRLVYRFRDVGRGDIVVFQPPAELHSTVPFVKRVLGVPGDTVEVKGGQVFINGEPFFVEGAAVPRYAYGPVTVPVGSVFVLGDNRNNSVDSHVWGFLQEQSILGEVFMTYWPLGRMRVF